MYARYKCQSYKLVGDELPAIRVNFLYIDRISFQRRTDLGLLASQSDSGESPR
jgi:hypothetical protein